MENYKAAAEGDINVIKTIKSRRTLNKKYKGKNVTAIDCEALKGKNLLYIACERGQTRVVEQLIEKGANIRRRSNFFEKCVDTTTSKGHLRHHRNPLHGAILYSQRECIQLLLKHAGRGMVNSVGYVVKYSFLGKLFGTVWVHKFYPIHFSCFTLDLETTKQLIELGATIDNREGTNGFSPFLCLFTSRDRLSLVGFRDFRLQSGEAGVGAQVDEKSKEEKINKHKQMAGLLLDNGANKLAVDKFGRNAVHLASMDMNIDMLQYALSLGISPHHVDYEGNTPLHNLIDRYDDSEWKRRIEIAKILITAGIDINAKNKSGKTLLHLCSEKTNTNVSNFVRELVCSLDADITLTDNKNTTPLFLSVKNHNNEGAIKVLLTHAKSNYNERDKEGNTLFHYLAMNPHSVNCMKDFLEIGLDINDTNNKGCSPLHTAAKLGNFEPAELLIENGAEVNTKDKSGNTPMHYASTRSKSNRVLQILVNSGADITMINNKGKSPLQVMSPKAQQYLGMNPRR